MTYDIDHARCSELLRPYIDKRLDESDAAVVVAHLETCDECAHELVALEALTAPVPGLGPGERDALRRRVGAQLGLGGGDRTVVPLPPPRAGRWRARLAPALGVAATVALLAAGAVVVGSLGERGGEGADTAAEGPRPNVFETEGPRPVFDSGAAVGLAAPAAQEGRADAGGAGAGGRQEATMEDEAAGGEAQRAGAPSITKEALRALGTSGEPFTSFAVAYRSPVSPEMQAAFLDELADAAPPDVGEQILECGRQGLAGNERVLPAYGAVRHYRETEILVLGFVGAAELNAPLDRYSFLLWPHGSCARVMTALSGDIRP